MPLFAARPPAAAAAAAEDDALLLRVDGGRAIRAKYPNGNPELSGPDAVEVLTYQAGWVDQATARPEKNPRPTLCGAHSLMPQDHPGSLYRCGKSD